MSGRHAVPEGYEESRASHGFRFKTECDRSVTVTPRVREYTDSVDAVQGVP